MVAILRIILSAVVLIGTIGFVIYQASQFLLGIGSVKRLIKRDFARLRKMLGEFTDGLIPLDEEELRLLSATPIAKFKKRRGYISCSGYLSTIYQEPLFAFAIKSYKRSKRVLMLVKSLEHEYKFHCENQETTIYKNDVLQGTISADGRLRSADDRESARLERSPGIHYTSIYTAGETVAHMDLRIDQGESVSDRAFSLFHEFKSENEDKIIVLALYQLLFRPNMHL